MIWPWAFAMRSMMKTRLNPAMPGWNGSRTHLRGSPGTTPSASWLPRNYPFGIQEAIWRILGLRVVLLPKKLDLSWYECICLSTSGLDIVFQTTKDLITFMGHTDPGIPLYIAQGGVSNTTARIMGDVFTMDEVGAYAMLTE